MTDIVELLQQIVRKLEAIEALMKRVYDRVDWCCAYHAAGGDPQASCGATKHPE
jgi:hypothetical protein